MVTSENPFVSTPSGSLRDIITITSITITIITISIINSFISIIND